MDRVWLAIGSASMFLAIAGGAFGAHALKDRLAPDRLAIYETGVRYQVYHALALLAVSLIASRGGGTPLMAAGIAFTTGTLVFSGSLYLLALTGARWLGAITPLGGLLFLAGWALLFYTALAPSRPASLT